MNRQKSVIDNLIAGGTRGLAAGVGIWKVRHLP